MVRIDEYINRAVCLLRDAFADRLLYVGLQGSYSRGEADENSDIDLMVVLDELTLDDLAIYRSLLVRLGEEEKSCGFLCGRRELENWNACEICQILHETDDILGRLADLVPPYTEADVRQHVKLSVGNLYHALCHRAVHAADGWDADGLRDAYKPVLYILQNRVYLETGMYWKKRKDLLTHLEGLDVAVLQTAATLKSGADMDAGRAFRLLFTWCQTVLQNT